MSQDASVVLCVRSRLLREALSRILKRRAEFSRIEHIPYTNDSIEVLAGAKPDVLLLDARSHDNADLSFVRRVQNATAHTRIILIGMEDEERFLLQAIRAGVVGFLHSDASSADIVCAIRAVANGEAFCPPRFCMILFRNIAQTLPAQPDMQLFVQLGLSRREQQLLPLIAQGLTNKEIASRLNLSEQTVKNHLYRIMNRLGAPDRMHLAEFWHRGKLAD
jgi:DNA-binding NarL/FixJ family response regulator